MNISFLKHQANQTPHKWSRKSKHQLIIPLLAALAHCVKIPLLTVKLIFINLLPKQF